MKTPLMFFIIGSLGLIMIGLRRLIRQLVKGWIAPRVIKMIASAKKIPFFPNGLAMTPEHNRHYSFGKNLAFDHYFTYTPDAGYLYQYLPKKTNWPNPASKYFLIENVGTKESVDLISKKLKEDYGEYSVDLLPGEKKILQEFKGNPTIQGMTDWQKFCWNWNIYWYGTGSGQEALLYDKVTFAEVDGDAKNITWRRNEQSAILFSCFFEYGVESDDAEDADNVRLRIRFSISGKCINPAVSRLKNENPLKRAYSMLQSCAALVIKMNSFHRLHERIKELVDNLPEELRKSEESHVQQIRFVFQDEIIKMLKKPENFIGFEWGPDSVNILQVEAVGEESKKLLQQIIDALAVQFENKIAIDKAIAANTIKEANAITDKTVAITKSEQLLTVRTNAAVADAAALKIETAAAKNSMKLLGNDEGALALFRSMQAAIMSDGNPNAILLAHALKGIGGITLNSMNLADMFQNFLNQPQSQDQTT